MTDDAAKARSIAWLVSDALKKLEKAHLILADDWDVEEVRVVAARDGCRVQLDRIIEDLREMDDPDMPAATLRHLREAFGIEPDSGEPEEESEADG